MAVPAAPTFFTVFYSVSYTYTVVVVRGAPSNTHTGCNIYRYGSSSYDLLATQTFEGDCYQEGTYNEYTFYVSGNTDLAHSWHATFYNGDGESDPIETTGANYPATPELNNFAVVRKTRTSDSAHGFTLSWDFVGDLFAGLTVKVNWSTNGGYSYDRIADTQPATGSPLDLYTYDYEEINSYTIGIYDSENDPIVQTDPILDPGYLSAGSASLGLPALSLTAYGGGSARLGLPALTLAARSGGSARLELPRLTLAARFGGSARLTLPPFSLTATGTIPYGHAALALPALTLQAFGGGSARLRLRALSLTAAATSPGYATARLGLPPLTLTAHGLVGGVGSATLHLPPLSLAAFGGGSARLGLPPLTLTATGTTTTVGSALLVLPPLTLTASGLTGAIGSAWLALSPLTLTASGLTGAIGSARLVLPPLTLTAGVVPAAEAALAVNLTTGAVTRLLLGGSEKLVTAHGRLYGLKNGALTRLEGDVDGTSTPVPATVRFAPQTFGTARVKRLEAVYLEGRAPDGVTLEVVADETAARRYQIAGDDRPPYGTRRVKTGKGVQFHTCGLVLRNRDGGELGVGGLELRVHALSRMVP